ncbi:hypothetical protein Dred_1659 [Desulforamulus reducens MI-1]|uniref:Bypass of forespore C C-terminal domain-containing protein n=1 Tax=Desulforamulus reducens (strain ATCC BAA-1160 / DSM 100696 / MI-1) TaxID=349161 RepID=A4J534_DESRM|nr:hypothetical protein [Desulforamulus reducens]ABO50187.1 hypothetical protein Dred_1659 [Desulforamulus reducens MI-1]
MLRRLFYLGLVGIILLFITGITLGGEELLGKGHVNYLSALQVFAQPNQPAIEPDSVIREENVFLCGDIEEVARKNTSTLKIKDVKDIESLYTDQGYTLSYHNKEILAQRKVKEFCSYHRNFRHLGIYNNKLAVFQGPLGYNQKLIRVENTIPVESLSAGFQVKLQQSMDFFQMTPETQAVLRYELEFAGEEALNAILENLDEFQAE